MAAEYIDMGKFREVITAMLNDKNVTRRDLELANYLYTSKSRRQVQDYYGGSKNRSEVSRALKRLAPYLEVDKVSSGTWYQLKRSLNDVAEMCSADDQLPGQMSFDDYK